MDSKNLSKADIEFINSTAKTIHSYLVRPDKWVYFSWGAKKPVATLYEGMAALQVSVNGFICKGKVIIAYNEGADTFEVYTFNRKGRLLETRKDVYFDELQSVVDSMVETKNAASDEYKNQIDGWLATI